MTFEVGPLKIAKLARLIGEPKEHVGAVAITFRGRRMLHRFVVDYTRAHRLDRLANNEQEAP